MEYRTFGQTDMQLSTVALVADFDFIRERTRIDDLALTLYFTCLKFLEHPLSDDYLQRVSSLVAAYDSGLDHPLTSEERAALPLAIIRQPLWSSVGGWPCWMRRQVLDDTQPQLDGKSSGHSAWLTILIGGCWSSPRRLR